MKHKFVKLLFLLLVFFGVSYSASAQIYVRIRPTSPVIIRPPQPSNVHVWIGNEWEPNGSTYRYSGGHWEAPPHQGDRWSGGHWRRHHHDGHEWVRGSWKGR